MNRKLTYDKFPVKSVRTIDDNGYLHVAVSNITKEQVAPYRGDEIPNYEELGFKATEIYNGYRPASELSKPETVQSLNGIPILLKHMADSAENPATNRVGSTGTDAEWKAPYLTNSLHIQDADAINRINDGTMREISMGYYYTPVKQAGEFNGKPYDFIMTDIACNHVALVEQGRAGQDVLVADSALTTNPQKQENTSMDKEKLLADLLLEVEKAGLDPNAVKSKIELLTEGEAEDEEVKEEVKTEEVTTESEDFKKGYEAGLKAAEKTAEDEETEEVKTEESDIKETEDEAEEKLTADAEEALKECGLDADDPVIQNAFNKGFAAGTKYGEEKEKEEPEKLDREHESEGEKKALGEDSYEKIANMVKEKIEAKYEALDEVKQSLGKVKGSAFDSAEAVYAAALKKEGINLKLEKSECKNVYRAFMAGKAKTNRNNVAMDSKTVDNGTLAKRLNSIKIGD